VLIHHTSNPENLPVVPEKEKTMGKKASPSRLRMRAERRAARLLDPVVQAKARAWALKANGGN
jgi:hypothetical protein